MFRVFTHLSLGHEANITTSRLQNH
jgi:hypothetical protein